MLELGTGLSNKQKLRRLQTLQNNRWPFCSWKQIVQLSFNLLIRKQTKMLFYALQVI